MVPVADYLGFQLLVRELRMLEAFPVGVVKVVGGGGVADTAVLGVKSHCEVAVRVGWSEVGDKGWWGLGLVGVGTGGFPDLFGVAVL